MNTKIEMLKIIFGGVVKQATTKNLIKGFFGENGSMTTELRRKLSIIAHNEKA
jgi:hypothetical protein